MDGGGGEGYYPQEDGEIAAAREFILARARAITNVQQQPEMVVRNTIPAAWCVREEFRFLLAGARGACFFGRPVQFRMLHQSSFAAA